MDKLKKHILKILLITLSSITMIAFGTGCTIKSEDKRLAEMREVVDEIQDGIDSVNLEDISKDFIDVMEAIEDNGFYDHKAVEVRSSIRSMINNLRVLKGEVKLLNNQ